MRDSTIWVGSTNHQNTGFCREQERVDTAYQYCVR